MTFLFSKTERFILNLLKECKTNSLHTALETSGYSPWPQLDSILEYTDLVLFDIKAMDSATHKILTGVPNELILENAVKV